MDLFNITNLSNLNKVSDCGISWNTAIIEYCNDWKKYLINYDFYIVCIWVFLIAGIISNFWNLKGSFNIDKHKIDYDLMFSIQNISIGVLIIRIFEVYYISRLYLGG